MLAISGAPSWLRAAAANCDTKCPTVRCGRSMDLNRCLSQALVPTVNARVKCMPH